MAAAPFPHVSYYAYTPSLPAAIVVSTLYTLFFLLTLFQTIRYKSSVWVIMVVASAMESFGYIIRCISIHTPTQKPLYVAQFALIVLAPVLMAAACYVLFGRIVYHVVPKAERTVKLLWMSPRWITPVFVCCDILALALQLIGAVQITSVQAGEPDAADKARKGKKIAQIGVAVQLVCFGLFAVIAVRFNFTSRRFGESFENRVAGVVGGELGEGVQGVKERAEGKWVVVDGNERRLKRNWKAVLRVTNAASACILIRSIYRMVDFSLGKTGYTSKHEWCMYVFDALVIFPVVVLYVYWHPGKYLPLMGFFLPKHAR